MSLLPTALLWPLEALLDRLVTLDPLARQRLQALEGRSLAIQLTRPAVAFCIAVVAGRLHLSALQDRPAAATLRGPAPALLSLLLRQRTPESLEGSGLEVLGDLQFVRQLQELLLGLDIDWPYQLGRVLGDIPTQALQDTMTLAARQTGQLSRRAAEDLRLFLQEESRLLPQRGELETFYDDIQALVLRLERFEARLVLREAVKHAESR
jgi:ubiquinone biosynthesis protein UbiJ